MFYRCFVMLEFKYYSPLSHTWLQQYLSPGFECCSLTSLPEVVVIFLMHKPDYSLPSVQSFWLTLTFLIPFGLH